jgi:PHD/YefM family antitoxin component YafN of YafNO toxin-antitoxin module
MNSIVPITRFNRGEANKIFDEVSENGVKIVLKNNSPACVLVNPSRYEAMVEALEDYALFFEAEKRLAAANNEYIKSEALLSELGVSDADLNEVVVDIG